MLRAGLGSAATPVTEKTLKRKVENQSANRALLWFVVNLCLAVFFFLEMTFSSTSDYFDLSHPSVWYVKCAFTVLFTFNSLVDLWRYVIPTLQGMRHPIALSPVEKDMLGVGDNAIGFKMSRHRIASAPANLYGSHHHTPPLSSSPCSVKPPSHYLYPATPTSAASPGGSPSLMGAYGSPKLTPNSAYKGQYSPGASPSSQGSFLSINGHSFNQTPGSTPHTPAVSSSVLFRDTSGSGGSLLRPRHKSSPVARHSPLVTPETVISDEASLRSYLSSYDEKEKRNMLGMPDQSPNSSPSFWAYNRSAADFNYLLGKYQYQLASRSPQSPATGRGKDDQDYPATYGAEEAWDKLEVDRETLDRWIANLRQWLSQTVLVPIIKEIDNVNKKLQRLGHGDLQIGDTSISALRQVAILKSQHVPSLNVLLSYLDISSNQEYIIQRYRDLARGGYICEFRWDQGGEYKGRKWQKDLPTDCVLVLHALCTYLDSCLPPHPKHPDGKIFTDQYFMKTPDKPDLKRENLLLFHSKINPPHYKVILGDDTWDLPKGRNNMFQAILLFLRHIKTKENGMLGRVNLGLSGVNILWVIDS
ncbi:transmembrane protein 209-like [Strongylocentrotus purpuratus]|uniref:Transmembrane protein 209 n=1 Tax=Strongylocentrotus purpuratus TaxID=7668 RepID=A0A7M7NZE1_STRPU|nr:transmembrane protein 209-like [Strongylocentrotus purpuratus]|eukprot:XP_780705.1 PREDICTED: transmembrane protein 209 [Strongylocentrotus purpuratus]